MNNLTLLQTRLSTIKFKQPDTYSDHNPGFHLNNLQAGLLALPSDTAQVKQLLENCNELAIPVVTQGGRTGLAGAAATTSDQLILDTRQLNQIISIDEIGGTAFIECGVTLENLETAANEYGLSCGIDLAARGTATIGGMVATNAGGIEAFRNGVMRQRVLGLEVVLADGRIMSDLKQVTKANEGYDIKQLFMGAEGTLGIITQIVLSLVPKEQNATTALVSCVDAAQAVKLFRNLRNQTAIRLLSAEIMWPDYARSVAKAVGLDSTLAFEDVTENVLVIIETSDPTNKTPDILQNTLMALLEQGAIENAIIAKNEKERNAIWRIREDSFVIDDVMPHGHWFDMSIPLNNLPEYTSALFRKIGAIATDLQVFLFAHLGDGNLHATITAGYPTTHLETEIKNAVYDGLHEMGGSFSAEHGIGLEKRDSLQKYVPTTNLDLMHGIKKLLDPNNIMNPDKVL